MRKIFSATVLLFSFFACHKLAAQQVIGKFPEIQKAKVIAVGESAHRVPEFAKYKANLFRELVNEGITKTLLIETNYSNATTINEYIWDNKTSSIDSVITDGLYGIYAGSEMAGLIQWMRLYNQGRPNNEKLSIKGIDAKSAEVATGIVEAFLLEKKFDFESTIPLNGLALLKELGVSHTYNIKKLSKQDQEKIEKTVMALRTLVTKYGANHPTIDLHQKVIEHALAFTKANPINFTNIRDANMAEFVLEHLKHEEKPVFLWAHNSHIAKSKSGFFKPTGHHLSSLLGTQYMAVGLDFHEGEVRNLSLVGTTKYEPLKDPNWIGNTIHQLAEEPVLVNMEDFKNVTIRNIGVGSGTYKTKSSKSFDYIVYFKTVSPS